MVTLSEQLMGNSSEVKVLMPSAGRKINQTNRTLASAHI